MLDLIRESGGDIWFSSKTKLEIYVPKDVSEPLRGWLLLHGALNFRGLIKALRAEASRP